MVIKHNLNKWISRILPLVIGFVCGCVVGVLWAVDKSYETGYRMAILEMKNLFKEGSEGDTDFYIQDIPYLFRPQKDRKAIQVIPHKKKVMEVYEDKDMEKDWIGNKKSIYTTLGATNHVEHDRAEWDYYATHPRAVEWLLKLERFNKDIWECACGEGHMSKILESAGYKVKSTDLIDRGYGQGGVDFLSDSIKAWHGDIITNPPYKYAEAFVYKALSIIPDGNKVAMFLKILFLEGQKRKKLFEKYPFKVLYVSSSRLKCALNGQFDDSSSAVAYGWFVWEKGFRGDPIIKWFN